MGTIKKPDNGHLVLFLMIVVYLLISVVAIPYAYAAGQNEGTPGTFTAVERECDRFSGCSWRGTFVSDDGKIRDEHADFGSEELKRVGDEVRAQKGVGRDASIYSPDSRGWIVLVVADIACLGYAVWFVRAHLRYRRYGRTTPGPSWHPDPAGLHEQRYWDGERWTEQVWNSASRQHEAPR